jgi:excisionase family DNA binding protein
MAGHTADEATTYLLETSKLAEVADLVRALRECGIEVPPRRPALVDSDGHQLELPQPVFDALLQVATALADGRGVTVAPHHALLTTQEAADFLGISRPTLVKLLDSGDIPHQRPGRHRRVRLSDLVEYHDRARSERRAALDRLAAEGEDVGLYEATAGPPPRTR